jgi:hypothetical protein
VYTQAPSCIVILWQNTRGILKNQTVYESNLFIVYSIRMKNTLSGQNTFITDIFYKMILIIRKKQKHQDMAGKFCAVYKTKPIILRYIYSFAILDLLNVIYYWIVYAESIEIV